MPTTASAEAFAFMDLVNKHRKVNTKSEFHSHMHDEGAASVHQCNPGTLQGDPNHLPQTNVDDAPAQYQLAEKPRPLYSVQSPG